jgi:hypothetical protein
VRPRRHLRPQIGPRTSFSFLLLVILAIVSVSALLWILLT